MSAYTAFVRHALLPVHEHLKGHSTMRVHRAMDALQWQTPQEVSQYQLQRLRNFLQDIGSNVPYFTDLFRELGFEPLNLSSLDDLGRLPLLGKAEIRGNTERLRATDAPDLARFNTGGSSGEPLVFYLGKERVSHDVAAKRRATRWWGVDIGDPEIVVWGSPIELGAQDRVRLLRDRLFRTRLLSAFEMSTDNLDRFIAEIRAFRPRMLFGYPSSLALIAQRARQTNQALDSLGIKVAFVTSERLYDHQRQQIEAVFNCPVANGYGGRDAGFIAHECPQGSLHITADDIVVEILRPDGSRAAPGEQGEIVTTHMATRDFPFVRYRTGDVGALNVAPCACGRGLPVLTDLQGRTTDFLVAQDGTVMHGLALIYVLRELNTVEEFKIIQESLDSVRVQVVPGAGWNAGQEQTVVAGFRERLGNSVAVTVELLPAIELEASGKRRYVISHVEHELTG
ncbi:MAG: phenylacetate--CoA ligase family protein [Halioglobus sp.]